MSHALFCIFMLMLLMLMVLTSYASAEQVIATWYGEVSVRLQVRSLIRRITLLPIEICLSARV